MWAPEIPKNLNVELPHDPAIPLLGIDPKELETDSKASTYTYVHSSTIHNNQKGWLLFSRSVVSDFAISFSKASSQPRGKPASPALASKFFTTEPPGKPTMEY